MAHNGGVLRHVVGDALVGRALLGGLEGGHADAVGDDLRQDLVVLHGRKLKLLQTEVLLAVQTDCFGFHR